MDTRLLIVLWASMLARIGDAFSLLGQPCENCLYNSTFCDEVTRQCMFGCKPGWLEPFCTQICNIQECRECIIGPDNVEQCSRCHEGFYGPLCDQRCSEHCLSFDQSDTCDFYGNCLFGCEVPYVGSQCDKQSCPYDHCVHCRLNTVYNFLYCSRCEAGYYWQHEHQTCVTCSSHCLNGPTDCDPFDGTCERCENGWFGSHCQHHCNIQNCKTCVHKSNSMQCKECTDGYYPAVERGITECKPCVDRNCLANCSSVDGSCPDGCKPGWYGAENRCDLYCNISHCEQCSVTSRGETVCSRCAEGYYMARDHVNLPRYCQPCPSTCSGTCDDRNGYCSSCETGYYGTTCGITCSVHCVNNSCNFYSGNCECENGWFGPKCDRSCPVTCTDCDSYVPGLCSSCEAGTYGDECEKQCNTNCNFYPGFGYRICHKATGKCQDGCRTGYYGDLCNLPCSYGCQHSCDRDTGNCGSGCTASYYGRKCDIPCPSNCVEVSSGYQRKCDMSGQCELGCKPGFYGNYCNKTCNPNCAGDKCDINGACILGCDPGYTGEKCNTVCSGNCPNSCSQNCYLDTCDYRTKNCTEGCIKGWWGNLCHNICGKNCVENTCHQFTGMCPGECAWGYYGDYCNKSCSVNCADGLCHKFTGRCLDGCLDSQYHGVECELVCPVTCENRTCDQDRGICLSCGLGKTGDLCEQDCLPGTYGQNCMDHCGHCKDSNPCNILDGNCPAMSGCEVGWTGSKCQKSLYQQDQIQEKNPKDSLAVVIGCTVGFVVVVAVVVVFLLLWRRHKMMASKKKTQEPVVVYRDASATIQHADGSSDRHQSSQTSGPDGDEDSSRSDTELLGNETLGLQVDTSSVVQQTNIYKMYKGYMMSGNKEQQCFIRISNIDATCDDSREMWNQLMNESELHRLCASHPNVVKLLTTYQNKNLYCVALEPCVGKCLKDHLQHMSAITRGAEDPVRDVRGGAGSIPGGKDIFVKLLEYCVDVASAVEYLHSLKVVHRQLQTQYVYVTETEVVKLGDFYWAQSLNHNTTAVEKCHHFFALPYNTLTLISKAICQSQGHVRIQMSLGVCLHCLFSLFRLTPQEKLPEGNFFLKAPEQLIRGNFTYQTDIWGLGLLLWEILSVGEMPFGNVSEAEHRQMVLDGWKPYRPQLAHQNLYRLMKNCWRYSVEDRPDASSVLQQLKQMLNGCLEEPKADVCLGDVSPVFSVQSTTV